MKLNPPPAWLLVFKELFGTSERFAKLLWKRYYPDHALKFQLMLIQGAPANRDQMLSRLRHLSTLLPPQQLIAASERVSPPNGKPRMAEVVRFEESVIRAMNGKGEWDWII